MCGANLDRTREQRSEDIFSAFAAAPQESSRQTIEAAHIIPMRLQFHISA